jgi:hypothetical protein
MGKKDAATASRNRDRWILIVFHLIKNWDEAVAEKKPPGIRSATSASSDKGGAELLGNNS